MLERYLIRLEKFGILELFTFTDVSTLGVKVPILLGFRFFLLTLFSLTDGSFILKSNTSIEVKLENVEVESEAEEVGHAEDGDLRNETKYYVN